MNVTPILSILDKPA